MVNDLTNEDTEKNRGQPWLAHSSQHGLIRELAEAGITVGLTYTVTIKEVLDENRHEYPETKTAGPAPKD